MLSILSHFKRYTLTGWLYFVYLKLSRKTVIIQGSCHLCGRCCRRVSLESGGKWLRKKSEFKKLLQANPEYERFSTVGRDNQGFLLFSCSWHDPDTGLCSDHENRLDICRDFPDRDLYFAGGEITNGCGYSFKQCTPFSLVLEKEINAKRKKNASHPCD